MTETATSTSQPRMTDRVVAVSSDSHAAPLLTEQLRTYCPRKHLEAFDAFAAWMAIQPPRMPGPSPHEDPRQSYYRNALTTGGWDIHQRLRDMNRDGVAAEVVFHGLNTGPRQDLIPFNGPFGAFGLKGYDEELVRLGRHIYNRWLADFCSVEPERHAGLAQLPIWDPEASAKEAEWAASVGLRGINFPRPQPTIVPYNDPVWDRLWAVCAAHDMPLTTHAQAGGAPDSSRPPAPGDWEVYMLEIFGDQARGAVPRLIFGGVFERFPNLKLVYTEVVDNWWARTLERLDDFYLHYVGREFNLPKELRTNASGPLGPTKLAKLPSEYCMQSVFIGGTTVAPFEAAAAVENGYDSQIMWGSDYPHPEGSWQYPRTDDETPMTHLHLRDSFARVEPSRAAAMIGGNAIRAYGLDAAKLQHVAARINSLTFAQLAEPFEAEPENVLTRSAKFAFRRVGPFA